MINIINIRKSLKDERGQALVLSLVVLLVLVMFMLLIVNVGQLTSEKMKLQNAADAAAYSAAIMEARALNYIAYTNRAMLAHLVNISQLMALRSYSEYSKDVIKDWSLPANYIKTPIFAAMSPVINVASSTGVPVLDAEINLMQNYQKVMHDMTRLSLPQIIGSVVKNYDKNIEKDGVVGAYLDTQNISNITDRVEPGGKETMRDLVGDSLSSFSKGSQSTTRKHFFMPCPLSGFIWCAPIFKKWTTKSAGLNISVDDITSDDYVTGFMFICVPTPWGPIPVGPIPWYNNHTQAKASDLGFSGMPDVLTYIESENKGIPIYVYLTKNKKFLFGEDEKISSLDAEIEHLAETKTGYQKRTAQGLTPLDEKNWNKNRLNAIAKAVVYYSRPDDTSEAENLFNPFWNARLAAMDNEHDTDKVIKNGAATLFSSYVTH